MKTSAEEKTLTAGEKFVADLGTVDQNSVFRTHKHKWSDDGSVLRFDDGSEVYLDEAGKHRARRTDGICEHPRLRALHDSGWRCAECGAFVTDEQEKALRGVPSPDHLPRYAPENVSTLEAGLAASLLARDAERMRRLAASSDPTEQLDDGSLLRVVRTTTGFRIDHLTKSAPSEPAASWSVGPLGKLLPAHVAQELEACSR